MTSWRALWVVVLEMLECCKSTRIYVVVDALDECQGDGMSEFLKLVVRTGLGHRSKVKWLLTSRPLDSAEQELLGGTDQELLSLELNQDHIAAAVKTYAMSHTAELDRRHRYGPTLRDEIVAALIEKAENTFLWISLVCGKLDGVKRANVLAALEELPPGLHSFYDWGLQQLNQGDPTFIEGCMRSSRSCCSSIGP